MSMTTKKAVRDKYIQKAKRCSLTLMDMQFMFPDMELPVKRPLKSQKRQPPKQGIEHEAVANPPQDRADGAAPQAVTCAKLRFVSKACVDGSTMCVYVNDYSPNRNTGKDGIKIIDKSTSDAIKAASTDLTIAQAQGAAQWEACALIAQFSVADPDDPEKIYTFDTSDRTHCACFNIGIGQDGSPLLSWSQMRAVYQLPDGSMWAEHIDFFDAEDLIAHAISRGNVLSAADEEKMSKLHDAELLRVDRIVHSRIANIECDSFVHAKSLPLQQENSAVAENCFFWRCTVNPDTLEISKS